MQSACNNICDANGKADPMHGTCIQDTHLCIECTCLSDADARQAQCTVCVSWMHMHAQRAPAHVMLMPGWFSALHMHPGCTCLSRVHLPM